MAEIWKRKMRTCFYIMDFDNDGVMSKKDFETMAEELGAPKKHDPVYQEELRRIFYDIWLKYSGSTATNEKELMTEVVMIDSLMKQRNGPEMKASFRAICRVFFDSVDTSTDGHIQLDEFRKAVSGVGHRDTSFAENTFKVIDSNRDGKISFDEYSNAFQEFMFSEDEDSPYNMLWGCLI